MVTPMPTAGPFTAAITGFRHLKIRSVTWPPPSRTWDRCNRPRRWPAASPARAGRRGQGVGAGREVGAGAEAAARAGHDDGADISSLSAASNASIISCCIVPLKALSLSGRFSVIIENLIVDLVLDGLIRHGWFPFVVSLCCFVPDVIPGRSQATSPESITTSGVWIPGLRLTAHPGMTKQELLFRRDRPRPLRARRPSNVLAMPSTPRSSKWRPTICTPIGNPCCRNRH